MTAMQTLTPNTNPGRIMKNMKFLVALALVLTTAACSNAVAPTQYSFYDNYTYYNDGIKLPTQAAAKSASFFPR